MSPSQLESDSNRIANSRVHTTSGRTFGKTFEIPDEKCLTSASKIKTSRDPFADMLKEQNRVTKVPDDVPLEVTEPKRKLENRVSAKEDPDATECSSSFADTTEENSTGQSDAEVESQLHDNGGLGSSYDDLSSFFPIRKKKVTTHWKNFIHPLMWRCKWAELKLKEFETLSLKYNSCIAVYGHKKRMPLDQARVEEFGSKSLPYTSHNRRKKPLKRRKRKKVETTINPTEYMVHHNLFSYQENKRSEQDGTSAGDDFGNPVFPGQDLDGDELAYSADYLAQEENNRFNEEMFRKIDLIHTRVYQMKSQLDSIMTKYGTKFSSCESLSHLVPGDLPSTSVRSPTFSTCNGDTMSPGGLYQTIQEMEYDLGDFVMPNNVVSSYGEGILIPDIIESTVGLLSSVDVTQHRTQVVDSREKIVDNIFIHNEAAGMKMATMMEVKMENQQDAGVSGEEESTKPLIPVKEEPTEEDPVRRSGIASEVQVLKCKRKRGERKGGSGGWSKLVPGDPESQT